MDEFMDPLSIAFNFTTDARQTFNGYVNNFSFTEDLNNLNLVSSTAQTSLLTNFFVNNLTKYSTADTIAPYPSLADIVSPSTSFTSIGSSAITTAATSSGGGQFDGSSDNVDSDDESRITIQTILISIILLAVILGTIIGNILVCVAVCLVRKLRRPCNYLLVSLAVSDLCVAVLVMPTALLYEILEDWSFGKLFCDIWVSFDVLSCTASILNLCAISVDRYWAITKPLEYGVKRTPRRMMLCVALVWLGAACISLPPLLIVGNVHEIDNKPACLVSQHFGYQIYATVGAFYFPLAVMLFVYYQIFKAARRIVMDEKRAQTRLEGAMNNGVPQQTQQEKPINAIGSPHQKKLRFQLAKERKASTTLGIIMSSFTICWLPFFILALVKPITGEEYETLSSIFLWLGYANSLLNPIIYATLNRDFRKPFQEILYFRCSSLNIMMREDFYHSQYGDPHSQRVVMNTDITQHHTNHGARESFL
jgi:5-hydroxytryptamine receptor 7